MTPERWRRIEDLFHVAVAQPTAARSAFLEQECANDPDLKREVEALLKESAADVSILEQPPMAVAAQMISDPGLSIASGRRLGVFEIQSLIGAGGMGEVYRARDTRLARAVAIKILPRAFTADPERLARFEREARLLATLNHPNVAAIYGLQDDDGVPALVLELVDGKTLAERLEERSHRAPPANALSIDEALTIARQLVDALDVAHETGIVHRDLKPANIKITPEGVVKVLDFGLAKAVAGERSGDFSDRPTVTTGTRPGVILGTPAYMSPEQARGMAVDKRTDIWAFGCVLYEMLTGFPAFNRKTISDTIAAVIERVPDWTALPPDTPPALAHLLRRCLEKDPKRRLRDIGDARVEFDGAMAAPIQVINERPTVWPRWIWGIASGLIVLGLGLGWTIPRLRQSSVDVRTVRLMVNPPAGTTFDADTGAAMSPDGRMVAFVTRSSGGPKLWVRSLNSLSARELPGTDAATFPFWSPDGRSLGFFAAGKLKRIEVAGGLPTVICDVGSGRGGTWNEEGVILFNAVNDGPLMRVSATGGTPVPFTTIDKAQGENSHRWPQFLSGGRRFLYFVRTINFENSVVYLGSLDEPRQKTLLLRAPTNAIYVPDQGTAIGHLLWVRDGTLMAQPFDPAQGHTTGEPVNVAEGVAFGSNSRLGAVSASNDGTLLYGGAGIRDVQFTWYDRDGKQVGEVGRPDPYVGLRISPDGKRVASTRRGDVWQMEFARGIPTRVTFGLGSDPLWSPDSQRIAYWKGPPPNLFAHSTNGTGDEERLIESQDSLKTEDWSPDGSLMLYSVNSNDFPSKTRFDLWVLHMTGGRKPEPFLSTPFHEENGQFSPDGKWVAYTSDESGGNEVYVQSFPAGGGKWQVSSKGGDWVRWRRDGREMFYIAADRKLMSVAVQAVSGSLEFGPPRGLFTIPFTPAMAVDLAAYTYDVMPDGQRFLAMVPEGDAASSPMTVILNWRAELSAREK